MLLLKALTIGMDSKCGDIFCIIRALYSVVVKTVNVWGGCVRLDQDAYKNDITLSIVTLLGVDCIMLYDLSIWFARYQSYYISFDENGNKRERFFVFFFLQQ